MLAPYMQMSTRRFPLDPKQQLSETVTGEDDSHAGDDLIHPESPEYLGHTFFSRFEQHELLGRGGFGVVYRAYDRKLKRFVAIKMPHRSLVDGSSGRRPLQREAEATARLRHPHIVALHEFILDDQDAILVSELIEGETLAAWLKSYPGGCAPRVAAALVWRMAQAVQHAHDQSVLHRDIKPSNILLDHRHHDTQLPFIPMLADFGVARIMKDETVTETHANFVGTYCYTPPEVICRGVSAHSSSSDIYSLGVVLYELLVGKKPFEGDTIGELLQKINDGLFAAPRQRRNETPRDLEAICLQCMSRRPADRYATAADLAADLERFLRGEPVRARHPGVAERAFRWVQRHPARVAMIAAPAIALSAFLFFLSATNHELERLNLRLLNINDQLTNSLLVSREALFYNEQLTYANDMQDAFQAIGSTGLRNARMHLARYADDQPLAKHRDVEWYYLCLRTQREPAVLLESSGPLYAMTPVGDLIAVGGAASQIALLDPRTRGVARQWPTEQGEVNGIVVDQHRNHLWCSGDDGTLVAYELHSGRELHRRQVFEGHEAHDAIIVPELDRLFCLASSGRVGAIELATGDLVNDWPALSTAGCTLVGIGEGRIAISDGLQLTLLDGRRGELIDQRPFEGDHPVQWMAVDPARKQLLVSCGKRLSTIDLANLEVLHTYPQPDTPTSIVYDAPRDRYVISLRGGGVHTYRVDDAGRLTFTDAWINDGERLYFAGISPVDGAVLTLGVSGRLHAWPPPVPSQWIVDAEAGLTVQAFDFYELHDGDVGPTLVIGSDQGLFLYRTADHSWTPTATSPYAAASLTMLAPDRFALGSFHQPVQIITLAGSVSRTFSEQGHPTLGVTSDGQWLMGSDRVDSSVWFRRADGSGQAMRFPSQNPLTIAISTQHQRVFWNDDLDLMTRSLSGNEPPVRCTTFRDVPAQLALSVNEQILAVGLTDREAHLWDWQNNEAIGPVLMHPSGIRAMTFSPFGRSLLTVDERGTLRSWNITTGELTLEKNFGATSGLAFVKFSRDARYLGLQYNTGTLQVVRLY